MTEDEWQRLTKKPGMTLYFLNTAGKAVEGAAKTIIARGATLAIPTLSKDGIAGHEDVYWPYQCLYAEKPEEKPVRQESPRKRRCKCCGRYFETANAWRKFCSESCQKYYFAKGPMPKEQIIKTCPVCGKKFPVPTKKREKIYCSRKCQAEGASRRWRHAEL